MKSIIKTSLAAMLAFGSLNAAIYTPDTAHSNVEFSIKHLQIATVKGVFKSYDALIDYDKTNNELKAFEANIKVESIDTRNEQRDAHLKNSDFFDTPNFPVIKFKMTKFEKEGKSEGKIYGDLTIKNVTKPIVLDFEYNGEGKSMNGDEKIGITLDGKILRLDFGIGEKFPELSISNKVEIEIEIEAGIKK